MLQIIWNKAYMRLLVVISIMLILLGNILVTALFRNRGLEVESRYMNELLMIEGLLDERMAVVNKNFKLTRDFFEGQITESEYDRRFREYFEYDESLGISLLTDNPFSNEGNIVHNGPPEAIADEDLLIMSKMIESFELQNAIDGVNDYDFWTAFYTGSYIIMNPWEDVVTSLGDPEVLFQGMEASMAGLNENLNEDLIENGWENGVFFDASGTMLMVQKGLPIMKEDTLIGMLSTNTYIEIVHRWMSAQPVEGHLVIVDEAGMLVYDSRSEVETVLHFSDIFDEKSAEAVEHTINALPDSEAGQSSMSQEGYEDGGYYYFGQDLEEVNWTMIHQVPEALVEGSIVYRLVVYGLVNGVLAVLMLLVLMLAIRKVLDEQAVAKQKDEFVMMVSHDLKTPLASIIGFTDLVRERFMNAIVPELDSSQKNQKNTERILRNLNIIDEEGQRLSQSIKNILDLAKMNSGSLMLIREEIELGQMLTEVSLKLKPLSKSKGVDLVCGPNDSCFVVGDRYYIYQLIVNLVENALKYTKKGHVSARFEDVGNQVRLTVEDTGIGIEPEMIVQIMKPFVREDKARNESGNGLGLTICQRIVEEHKGILSIESEAGLGTRVTVFLPKGE